MKKNLGLILTILGAAMLVFPSILGLPKDLVGRLGAAGIFVLIVGIVINRRSKKQQPAASAKRPAAAKAAPVAPVVQVRHETLRVVGTSFENEDGTKRQVILRHLKFLDAPYVDESDPDLTPEIREGSYQGRLSLPVFVNGFQIGFVSEDDVPRVHQLMQQPGFSVGGVRITGGGQQDGRRYNYGAELTLVYRA